MRFRPIRALPFALVLALGLIAPAPAAAQRKVLAPVLGGIAGVGSGGYLTLALVVARARAGHYLHEPEELFGWQSAPVLIGGGTGIALGVVDPDRLVRTVIGGSIGAVGGMGLGLLIGRAVWDPPEGKWAGAAIGAGVGLMAGCIIGVFAPIGDTGGSSGNARTAVPIGLTIKL